METKSVSYLNVLGWTHEQCIAYLESKRWPEGPVCPHCGVVEQPYVITRKSKTKNKVRSVYKCRECRKQFTVTVGTIFEGSHIPLNKWFAAIFLMCASKKGVSSHQIHRMIGVTYKSALFLTHRIRHAMQTGELGRKLSGVVEADATYVGGKLRRGHPVMHERIQDEIGLGLRKKDGTPRVHGLKGKPHPRTKKAAVFGMVERGGDVRTMAIKKSDETAGELKPIMLSNLELSKTHLMTDGHSAYRTIKGVVKHDVINHEIAYVEGDVHTQNIESFWSLLKRGMFGTFHHVSRHRLPMYLSEFEYRFNQRKVSDGERFEALFDQLPGRLRWNFRQPE